MKQLETGWVEYELTNTDKEIVARCHKIEPFDVIGGFDRESAFEEAKKLQDSGQDVSIIFASSGEIYMQFLTKDDLFLHQPLFSSED